MRNSLRALSVLALFALSACAGANGTVAVTPRTAGDAPSAARAVEAQSAGSIYLAFKNRVDVYAKSASGTPAPVRSITGLPSISAIALDRFGYLYVAEANSWTVRKFAPNASGHASPLRVFVAPDPQSHSSADYHAIVAIGLRYDGGIAALAAQQLSGSSYPSLRIGVFHPSDGEFDVAQVRSSTLGAGLAVDGSGDVLFGFSDSTQSQPALVQIERFSPHPPGFNDDGPIAAFGPDATSHGIALAASPSNMLQVNEFRCTSSGSSTTCVMLNAAPQVRQAAFDAEGRLFSASVGPSPGFELRVEVFAAVVHPGQNPERSFHPAHAWGYGDPTGIAVTN